MDRIEGWVTEGTEARVINGLTVERVGESARTVEYRVSRGRRTGGEPVRVRVGEHGHAACMTCLTVTCEHARAVDQFDREVPMPPEGTLRFFGRPGGGPVHG